MDQNIILAAQLCRASYVEADSRFTTVGELRYGVIVLGGTTYIVFRGTANIRGWLDDFTLVPGTTKGGYLAHEGFIKAAEKLWNPICSALNGRPGPWIITGHSLGGALSVLFAEQIKVPLITFGCPRVYSRFNGTFPEMEHTRIANNDDPVPMVPDPLMWHHLCDPIELPGGKEIIDAEDHDIDVYIDRISRVLLSNG
jgi:hypothetical protein